MAGNQNAFQALGDGIVVAMTTTTTAATAFPGNGDCVALMNEGATAAYVSFTKDNSASVATAWQHVVPAGQRIVVWVGQAARFFAAKINTGTGNLNMTRGEGRV